MFRYLVLADLEITQIVKMPPPEEAWDIQDIPDLCHRFKTIEEAMLFTESAGSFFGNRIIEVNFAPCYQKFYETGKILPFDGEDVPGCGFFGWRMLV